MQSANNIAGASECDVAGVMMAAMFIQQIYDQPLHSANQSNIAQYLTAWHMYTWHACYHAVDRFRIIESANSIA